MTLKSLCEEKRESISGSAITRPTALSEPTAHCSGNSASSVTLQLSLSQSFVFQPDWTRPPERVTDQLARQDSFRGVVRGIISP